MKEVVGKSTIPGKQGTMIAAVAVLAILGGIFLPQFLPETTTSAAPPVAKAGDSFEYQTPQLPPPVSAQTLLVRLAYGSLLVAGLAWACLWGLKRWGKNFGPITQTPTHLHIVESIGLGNRCSVHLLTVRNQTVLVGTDAGGIKTILPLTESFANYLETPDDAPAPTNPGG